MTYRCHFLSETYVPCLFDFDLDCPYHGGPSNPRTIFQGSLPVVTRAQGLVYLVNPTARALRMGEPALADREDLLGRELVFGRKTGGRNAAMYWRDQGQVQANFQGKGFSDEEIWRTQLNIWGVEIRAEGSLLTLLENERGRGADPTNGGDRAGPSATQ